MRAYAHLICTWILKVDGFCWVSVFPSPFFCCVRLPSDWNFGPALEMPNRVPHIFRVHAFSKPLHRVLQLLKVCRIAGEFRPRFLRASTHGYDLIAWRGEFRAPSHHSMGRLMMSPPIFFFASCWRTTAMVCILAPRTSLCILNRTRDKDFFLCSLICQPIHCSVLSHSGENHRKWLSSKPQRENYEMMHFNGEDIPCPYT